MYKTVKHYSKGIEVNKSLEGETIELKVERILVNKEPIKDGAPLIYTDRKEGVQAGYNIKTDRFEIAVEAMDVVSKSVQAKRDNIANMKIIKDSEAESFNGTDSNK